MGLVTQQNRRWWTLGAVTFSLFVITLDNTVVNVALPAIQRDLGGGLEPAVVAQRQRADRRSVEEHHLVGSRRPRDLALSLQVDDVLDEAGLLPRGRKTEREPQGDDVGGGLLDDTETVTLDQPQERGLPGARGTGEDEAEHHGLLDWS